jgi:protein SCO1/2
MNKWNVVLVAALAIASLPGFAHEAHHHHGSQQDLDQARPQPLRGESLYNLDSTWTSQDGTQTKLSTLQGQPVVVAMVFTSCQAACPMTISDLKRIEEALPAAAKSQVRFAVFSFDSKRDTPAKLKEFVKARSLDTSRWTLFHGEPSAVRQLSAVLGIRYKKDKNGDFDHSNVITILDKAGAIAHQQVGLRQDSKETVAKLIQLSGASAN